MLMLWVSLVTIGHQTNVLKTTVGPLTSCERVKLAANRVIWKTQNAGMPESPESRNPRNNYKNYELKNKLIKLN